MKGTDQHITIGEYSSSWFKGPFRVLEELLRIKYGINKLFDKLSSVSLRTSNKNNIIKYLKILFKKGNDDYKKMKKYKYDSSRQKWKYTRQGCCLRRHSLRRATKECWEKDRTLIK